jgi:hypothetical protein
MLTFDVARPEHAGARTASIAHRSRIVRAVGEPTRGGDAGKSLALALLGNLS